MTPDWDPGASRSSQLIAILGGSFGDPMLLLVPGPRVGCPCGDDEAVGEGADVERFGVGFLEGNDRQVAG